MLHLAPELVDMSAAARNVPEHLGRQPLRALRRAGGRSAGCRTTSAPTATSATRPAPTAERGKELFAGAVDALLRGARRDRRASTRTGLTPVADARRPARRRRAAVGAPRGAGRDRRDQGSERRGGLRPPGAHRRRQGGPRPRRRLDARPRPRRRDRRHRQRRRHPPGHRPGAAPVMTGSHIDTVATGGRFDGNLGVLAGLEVIETLEQHGVATERPLAVAFFTDEEGARFAPDMLGSLVYAGGMALEEALDVAVDDGAASATSWPASATPAHPVPGGGPARLRRAAHRAGSDPRGRRHHDRRRRGRAGHLLDRAHDRRPVGPRGHDADGDAPRRRLRRRGDHGVRPPAGLELGGHQVATVGRCRRPRTSSTSCPQRRRSPSTCATPTSVLRRGRGPAAAEVARLAAAEGVTVDALAGPLRAGRLRPGDGRPGRVDGAALGRRRGACRAAPATTPRCWPVCPAAMIFTPSVNGLSHNIAEHHPADVTAGADVLLQTLLTLAVAVPCPSVSGAEVCCVDAPQDPRRQRLGSARR